MKTLSFVVVFVVGVVQIASGQLHGLGVLQGKIVNEKGAPLADVTFTATLPRVGAQLTGTSNEKGEWKIVGMAHGAWDITFDKRGYARSRAKIQFESELSRFPPMMIRMRQAD